MKWIVADNAQRLFIFFRGVRRVRVYTNTALQQLPCFTSLTVTFEQVASTASELRLSCYYLLRRDRTKYYKKPNAKFSALVKLTIIRSRI